MRRKSRRILAAVASALGVASSLAAAGSAQEERPRARDLGIAPGVFAPGPHNAISDVPGVRVGHLTLIEGEGIRTGATAIVPHPGNLFQERVPAAIVVANGWGKLVGFTQVRELGELETPIILTNTLNVWEAAAALVEHTLALPGNEDVGSVNPVVGETNDGWLNDIRRRALTKEQFLAALDAAADGPVAEGSVGAGTGTGVFWPYKGGIGTSSRRLPPGPDGEGGYTVGVLVQSNFDGVLTVDGVPVGRQWGQHPYSDGGAGSCMIVVATDAPLLAPQLERLARRALAGMARTGADFQHGSGDYVIAFSAAPEVRIRPESDPGTTTLTALRSNNPSLSPLFQAVAEATEEAIYNSLLRATTVRGFRGREMPAIPIDELEEVLVRHGRGRPRDR